MGTTKVHEAIQELLKVMKEEGYQTNIDIRLPLELHVDLNKKLHSHARTSFTNATMPTALTDPIKFNYELGGVNFLRPYDQ